MRDKGSWHLIILLPFFICGAASLLFSLINGVLPFNNLLVIITSLICALIAMFMLWNKKVKADRDSGDIDELLDLEYMLKQYEVTEKNNEIYEAYVKSISKGKAVPISMFSKLNRLLKKRGFFKYKFYFGDTFVSYGTTLGLSVVAFGWCCALACAVRLLVTLKPLSALFWVGLVLAVVGYAMYGIYKNVNSKYGPEFIAGLIACAVIVGLPAIMGTMRANHIDSTCSDIHMTVVEKCEATENSRYIDGYVTAFKIEVLNEKNKDIIQLEGEMHIYGSDGDLLDSSLVTLSGDILSGESAVFTLNLDRRYSEDVAELYYATAKELSATFKITHIVFDGYHGEDYPDSRLMEILSLGDGAENDGGYDNDEQTTEEKYLAAIALYENGQYSEAIAVFEQMSDYKDSANYISLCEEAIEEARKAKIYAEAISLFESGNYSAAMKKFDEIVYYKDSSDYIEECQAMIATQDTEAKYLTAKALYEQKEYVKAYDAFYSIKDYKDSWDMLVRITNDVEALSISYADEGDYQSAFNILYEMGYSTSEGNVNYLPILKAYNYASAGDYKSAVQYGLAKIVLPTGTTEITSGMFEGCTDLIEVIMPDTVKSIGSSAFSGCSSLEKLTLSKNLESIGRSAFSNCDALDKLVLPVSLKSIVTYGLNSMDGEIHYEGTVAQWEQVKKDAAGGTLNKIIHCVDGDVQP